MESFSLCIVSIFFALFSDLELYNEAIKIIHEFHDYFPFGTEKNNWFFLAHI